MARAGRKRKDGAREPNGRLQRTTTDVLNAQNLADIRKEQSVVLNQPHRFGKSQPDHPWHESALGSFCLANKMNDKDIFAGVVKFAEIKRAWSLAKGVPRGTENASLSGSGAGPSDETVKGWEKRWIGVQTMLCISHGTHIFSDIHKLAVEGEALRSDLPESRIRAIINGMLDVAIMLGTKSGRINPF